MAGAGHPERAFLGVGWSFPPAPAPGGEAAMAAYEEDVRQAVLVILETGRGERVMRPDFGADLRALVFEPLSTTTMALVRHRVEEALVTWEPRIDLREVRVAAGGDDRNALLVEIDYVVRATNTFYNLVYPFHLLEGERT
jgi:phage baseplate assembly protein W